MAAAPTTTAPGAAGADTTPEEPKPAPTPAGPTPKPKPADLFADDDEDDELSEIFGLPVSGAPKKAGGSAGSGDAARDAKPKEVKTGNATLDLLLN